MIVRRSKIRRFEHKLEEGHVVLRVTVQRHLFCCLTHFHTWINPGKLVLHFNNLLGTFQHINSLVEIVVICTTFGIWLVVIYLN